MRAEGRGAFRVRRHRRGEREARRKPLPPSPTLQAPSRLDGKTNGGGRREVQEGDTIRTRGVRPRGVEGRTT